MRPHQERDRDPDADAYGERRPRGRERRGQMPEQPPVQGGRQPPPERGQQPPPDRGRQPPRQSPPPRTEGGYARGGARYGGSQPRTGAPPPQQQPRGGAREPQGMPPARPRLRPVTVEEIVQTDVVTAAPDTPIPTVVAEMAEQDVGSVVIVEGDSPVGIITDRGIALAVETDPNIGDRRASDVAARGLVTGTVDMSVFDALRRMREEGIRRLPIVDDEGALEGIVTLDDVLVLLGSELRTATEVIEAQSPRL